MAVVASALTGPTSADAATRRAHADIVASLRAGTVVDDIASGRITVDQLVDADLAAWAGGGTQVRRPSRAEVTREMTAEVRALREPDPLPAPGTAIDLDATPSGTLTATRDPLRASESWKSFWHRAKHALTHWTTVRMSDLAVKLIVGGSYATGAAILCSLPGVGTLMCGLAYAAIGALMLIFTTGYPCRRGFELSIPDFADSRCAA